MQLFFYEKAKIGNYAKNPTIPRCARWDVNTLRNLGRAVSRRGGYEKILVSILDMVFE